MPFSWQNSVLWKCMKGFLLSTMKRTNSAPQLVPAWLLKNAMSSPTIELYLAATPRRTGVAWQQGVFYRPICVVCAVCAVLGCASSRGRHGSLTVSRRRSKTYLLLVKLAVSKLRWRLDFREKQASQFLRMHKSHDRLRHRAANIRDDEHLSVIYKTLCEESVFALRQRNSVTQSTTDAKKRASGIINHCRPERWLARSTRKRTGFWAFQSKLSAHHAVDFTVTRAPVSDE